MYRVKQEGVDEDLEEYLVDNFKYYLYKVKDFYLANLTRLGPPTKLLEQLEAQEKGLDSYKELDNLKAIDRSLRASFFQRKGQ